MYAQAARGLLQQLFVSSKVRHMQRKFVYVGRCVDCEVLMFQFSAARSLWQHCSFTR